MPEKNETMSVSDVMKEYGISRMTVHRRVKEGKLKPVNTSKALYRQHKLLFSRQEVEQSLGKNNQSDDKQTPANPKDRAA